MDARRSLEGRARCARTVQDSDGFVMNRLEEGAFGDPVLAGNLVLNPNGRRSQRMGLRRPGRLERLLGMCGH